MLRQSSLAHAAAIAITLTLLGCSSSSPVAAPPIASAGPSPFHKPVTGLGTGGTALPGGTLSDGLLQESALGIWNLHVDPTTLSASVTPQAMRSAQQNDDVYELPLDNLVNPGSFEVQSITVDADSVDVTWQFTHPFAAPANIDAPATAANRADLGISGRVLYLADVANATGNKFFEGSAGDDTLILNPGFAQNADGFVKPRGLVTLSGFTANTFPFQALVDERTNGNRIGISNEGDVRGNYDSGNGWQKEDFGANRNGFTGYGILHQGQAVTRIARFDLATLQSGTGLDLGVAILAKYVDPRGGATIDEKKANRLPGAVADVAKFCYREPHGSLDIEALRYQGQIGSLEVDDADDVVLRFTVVDWDARTTETTEADLANETTTSRIALGAGGPPTLAVCVPGIIGDATVVNLWSASALQDDDSTIGGDAAADSGRPGDGLFYSDEIVNEVTGQTRGTYYGVVCAIDPEDNIAFGSPRVFLDANLLPISTDLPRVRVYQAFPVTLGNSAPSIAAELEASTISSGTRPVINILTADDADGDPITVEIDWDDNDQYEDSHTILAGSTASYAAPSNFNNPVTSAYGRTIKLRYSDGIVTPIDRLPNFELTIGTNRRPQVATGEVQLRWADIAAPGQFIVQGDGSLAVSDPEGDPITYVVSNDLTAETESSSALPMPGHLTPFAADLGPITFSVYATDANHPASPGTRIAQLTGRVHGSAWAHRLGGASAEFATAMEVTADRIFLGVQFASSSIDVGGGPLSLVGSSDAVLVAYDLEGRYLWDRHIKGAGLETIEDVAVSPAGQVYVVGGVSLTADFGGGGTGTMGPRAFLARYFDDGTFFNGIYLNQGGPGGPQSTLETCSAIVISADSTLTVAGYYQGDNANFGGATYTDGNLNGHASFVLDLDADGLFVRERVYNSGNFCVLGDLALDPLDERVYVGGSFTGTQNFGGAPVTQMDGSILFGLDSNLGWLFNRSLLHSNIYALAPLPDGLGVVAGGIYVQSTDFGGGTRLYAGGGADSYLAMYTQQGTYTDDLVLSATGYESLAGVSVDAEGNVLATGDFSENLNFGGGVRPASMQSQGFAVKYARDQFNWLWDAQFPSTDPSYGFGIAATPGDDAIVSGSFSGVMDVDPGAGVWNLTAPGISTDAWIQRLRGDTGRL